MWTAITPNPGRAGGPIMSDFQYRTPEEIRHAQNVYRVAFEQYGGIDEQTALRVIDDVIAELKWHQDSKSRGDEFQRLEIAKCAMQGYLSNSTKDYLEDQTVVQRCFQWADELIKQAKK